MKSLGDIVQRSTATIAHSESAIEALLFDEFMRHPKFILVQDDSYSGEGFFIWPQKEIGPYRLDFYIEAIGFHCLPKVWPPRVKTQIIVECDGAEFHSSDDQKKRDKERDQYFLKKGIPTHRFTGSQIYRWRERIVKEIVERIEDRLRV